MRHRTRSSGRRRRRGTRVPSAWWTSAGLPAASRAARALRPKDLLAPVHDLGLRAQRRHIRLNARLARLTEHRLALRVALLEPCRRVGRDARQRLHQEVARLAREQPARLARPEPERRAEHQGLHAQLGGWLDPGERAELLYRSSGGGARSQQILRFLEPRRQLLGALPGDLLLALGARPL